MTNVLAPRPASRALTVCSIILIAVSIPAALYEFNQAVTGAASASDALLAVAASSLSALVGLVFLAWVGQAKPTVGSWLSAFAWGTGGALLIAGYGNGFLDAAIEASSLSDTSVELVTSAVTGPLVEEFAKGIGVCALLFAARRALERPAQGGLLGALVGMGFAWGEDVGYYVSALEEGLGGLWESFVARALLGAYAHAIFTGVFGYALAWAFMRANSVMRVGAVSVAGFIGALVLHAQANGIGLVAPEDAWHLVYGAIEVPVLVGAVALLTWGLRRSRDTLEA